MVELIEDNVAMIREKIAAAAKKSGRAPGDIRLMGVSKYHPLEMMIAASSVVDMLGENRVQEAEVKKAEWPAKNHTPWHLIGHLQRNKARKALHIFNVIETVDSLDLARMLDRVLAETDSYSYGVFLEINMSGEVTKSGVCPSEAKKTLDLILTYCTRLSVQGLMTVGPRVKNPDVIRRAFAGLRELREEFSSSFGLALPELSMGMSDDFEIAIEEGSTIVRVGTAIFGPRVYPRSM